MKVKITTPPTHVIAKVIVPDDFASSIVGQSFEVLDMFKDSSIVVMTKYGMVILPGNCYVFDAPDVYNRDLGDEG